MGYVIEISGELYGPFVSGIEAQQWANFAFPSRNQLHDPVRALRSPSPLHGQMPGHMQGQLAP